MITLNPADMSRLIKELREKTGAGITACKKALEAGNWNLDEAMTSLRKQGQADMAKRSARATKEGAIAYQTDGKNGALIELNCETDFVARTDEFKALARSLAEKACAGEIPEPAAAASLVEAVQTKMRENMTLRRLARFTLQGHGLVAGYIHLGAKNGSLIELATSDPAVAAHPATAELAKELLLQIVGCNAKYLRREDVPADEISKEKEIYAETLRKEGKPEAAIPKIVEGKVNKLFYQASCLLEQLSVRDGKTPIAAIIKEASAKAGGDIRPARFARYTLGE